MNFRQEYSDKTGIWLLLFCSPDGACRREADLKSEHQWQAHDG